MVFNLQTYDWWLLRIDESSFPHDCSCFARCADRLGSFSALLSYPTESLDRLKTAAYKKSIVRSVRMLGDKTVENLCPSCADPRKGWMLQSSCTRKSSSLSKVESSRVRRSSSAHNVYVELWSEPEDDYHFHKSYSKPESSWISRRGSHKWKR